MAQSREENGVYQLESGLWAYRFSILVDGQRISRKKTTDAEGNKLKTQKQAAKARDAAIAAAKNNTLVGPIQGANGVYMFYVNSKVANPAAADPTAIKSQKEQGFMQSLRGIQQVLKDKAKVIDQRNKFF